MSTSVKKNKEKSKIHSLWRRYYKMTYRIVAFTLCTFLMVLSFPGAGRFSYDYEVKRPWRYENIIAPYDFPILKTEAELSAERDSLMKVVIPYYDIDTVVEVELLQKIHSSLYPFSSKIKYYCPHGFATDTLYAVVENAVFNNFKDVMSVGILETSQSEDMAEMKSEDLMLIRGNLAEPYRYDDLYTMREAYSQIVVQTISDVRRYYGIETHWVRQLIEALPISDLIEPNVHYDEVKSESAANERMTNISLSSGMIVAGQLVVGTGDIVDARTAQILESLRAKIEGSGSTTGAQDTFIFIGKFVLVGGLMFSIFLFLYYFRRDYYRQLHFVNLILLLMTFMVCVSGLLANNNNNISFIIPYVVLPIMLRIFTDARLAMYVNTVTILIISFFAFNSQLFIILHIPAGLLACVILYQLNKRIQIFRCAVYMFAYYCVMYTGYYFWQKATFVGDFTPYAMFAISSVLMLLTYPLIYVVEKMFGFVSDVTLMEMCDMENVLLRRLSEEAPGTYQHSIQVANIGREVARRIGGNALLVRAGAMYHDIGKLKNPMFFTENQLGGKNPLDEFSTEKKAEIIVNHVKDGVALAEQYNLPKIIVDIIRTHHGNKTASYFYSVWCSEHPDEEADMSIFQYEGPKPRTKEEAIIMMADVVEASSKSLSDYSHASIDAQVDKVLDELFNANQLEDAPITFAEFETAREVFKDRLKSVYSTRIKYVEPTSNVAKEEEYDEDEEDAREETIFPSL